MTALFHYYINRPTTLRLMNAMCFVSDPIENAHKNDVSDNKTVMGVREWRFSMSERGYDTYVAEIPGVLEDPQKLREMGFNLDRNVLMQFEMEEDMTVSKVLFDLTLSTMDMEIAHMRHFSCRPPHALVGCVHPDPTIRSRRLEWCTNLRKALFKLDHAVAVEAKTGATFLATYRKNMVWPGTVFSREVLIAQSETGDETLPKDIEDDLNAMALGPWGSLINEQGNQVVNGIANHCPSGAMGRHTRWHRLLHSSLVTDFDWKHVPITPAAKTVAAPYVSSTVYSFKEAKQGVCSIGNDALDLIDSEDLPGYTIE